MNVKLIYAATDSEQEGMIPSFNQVTDVIDEETGKVISSSGITYSLARGVILKQGFVSLSIKPSGKIGLYGYTDSYEFLDTIKLSLYLDRRSSGTDVWTQVATWPNITAENAKTVSESIEIYPSSGTYYYRLRGTHYGLLMGFEETVISFTNEVEITR